MIVESVTTTLVDIPLPKPIGTAIHAIRSAGCCVVTVRCAEGVRGQSHLFTINAARLRSFDEMVRGLGEAFVVGRDVRHTEAIWHDIFRAVNPAGPAGVTISALSTLDVACWDAVGRALGQPLHLLWGACRDSIDTYASSGLWLSATIDELQAEAAALVDAGFRALKIRVGHDDPEVDARRVAAVRDAVGPQVGLLADANQKYRPVDATRLGRMLAPYDIGWLEEPVPTHDRVGHARVRDGLNPLGVAIATGETEYTRHGARDMLAAGACDVYMPDLQRVGGYSEFRKVAALCAGHDVPVSSHFYTEQTLCLAGSIDNLISVEHIDWFAPLYREAPELVEGRLVVPDRPGTGFSYNPEALARYRIA
ncbi:MAG: mandelate racemase/muconate lactonizing enzyme family protein [Acidimicrobiia bacterium]|nr:mandelate racemase/muconate lactonizing enzyme family protein [Acidimicrobiia bacterium]